MILPSAGGKYFILSQAESESWPIIKKTVKAARLDLLRLRWFQQSCIMDENGPVVQVYLKVKWPLWSHFQICKFCIQLASLWSNNYSQNHRSFCPCQKMIFFRESKLTFANDHHFEFTKCYYFRPKHSGPKWAIPTKKFNRKDICGFGWMKMTASAMGPGLSSKNLCSLTMFI